MMTNIKTALFHEDFAGVFSTTPLADQINDFTKGKDIVDIKYQTISIQLNDEPDLDYSALVIYKDGESD